MTARMGTHPFRNLIPNFLADFQNMTYWPITIQSSDLCACIWQHLMLFSKLLLTSYHSTRCSTYQLIWPVDACTISRLLCMKFHCNFIGHCSWHVSHIWMRNSSLSSTFKGPSTELSRNHIGQIWLIVCVPDTMQLYRALLMKSQSHPNVY